MLYKILLYFLWHKSKITKFSELQEHDFTFLRSIVFLLQLDITQTVNWYLMQTSNLDYSFVRPFLCLTSEIGASF